jgi:hypothetical protein
MLLLTIAGVPARWLHPPKWDSLQLREELNWERLEYIFQNSYDKEILGDSAMFRSICALHVWYVQHLASSMAPTTLLDVKQTPLCNITTLYSGGHLARRTPAPKKAPRLGS